MEGSGGELERRHAMNNYYTDGSSKKKITNFPFAYDPQNVTR